ncbi:MAG: peptide-methionine (S)-S-oxide reductase MsrA [Candidatus Melainabacteria bacterium]|nr:peptide-methionine (S)-S-oxide reductase MsrA [Candidatus Melainabacteria bacterium]
MLDPHHPDSVPDHASATETATFAAGCFWGVEDIFMKIPGVASTSVGYTGGQTDYPTYEQVCTGKTGHAEAVQLIYDPARVTYEALLDIFWRMHDPTTPNRQGPDIGSQYRSAIFYHSAEQAAQANASLQAMNASGRFPRPIVTQIQPAVRFYPAEDYHQQYFAKRGGGVSCHVLKD